MYLKEIVACLFFFIPGLLGYYQVAPFVGWQIPLLLLFILILPVFALSVGSLGGVLVAYVSSRLPFRRLLSVVGTLAFMVAVFFVSFQSTSFFDPNQLAYWLPETPGTLLGSALVLASGPLSGNGWALLLLLALSVGIFSVFFFVLDRFHDRISEAVHAPRLKKEYRLAQAARAPWKALLQKDMHLLFSNTNFLINSISGIVLLALAVGALIYQRDMVGDLGVVLSLSMDEIFFFAAVGICFLLMSGLSSVILSAEGKELEILKSLPVASRTVILTKLLPQWGIEGGAALLATLVVGIAFRISLSSVMLALTYILLQSYVLSQIGMIVGLHLPNFHWKTLVHLIKQSGAAGFNMLFGFIQGVVHFGIYFALQLALPSFLAFVLLCGLSGIQLAIQHRWLVTRGVVRYEEILP